MFTQLETGAGLDVILAFQAGRTPFLDALAALLNVLGSPLFYIVVLLLLFWSLNRPLGLRLLFALIVAGLLTVILKDVLHRPRPYQVSSLVVPLFTEAGFGIPSGHVLFSTVMWGLLATEVKRRWVYGVTGIYVLVMAWGRMYSGVHYPQDVAVGLVAGLLALAFLVRYHLGLVRLWQRLNTPARVAVPMLVGLAVALVYSGDSYAITLAGVLIGSGPALELQARYADFQVGGTAMQRVLRYLIGMALVVVVLYGLRALFGMVAGGETDALRVIRYASVPLVAILVWPWLMLRAGLAQPFNPGETPRSAT